MKNMTLKNIAEACGGTLHGHNVTEEEAQGVVLDSRKGEPGFVFVASRGEKTDGHQYIDDVFQKGAIGVVCEMLPEVPKGPCIVVKDSLLALQDIAKYYREQLDITVVGITGSVGKTSTKECIASVLEQKYKVLKTEGNYNNEIGLPLMVLKINSEHEIAVLEMGINHFGEMRRLSRIAQPDICVMTNIGPCHLEFLNSLEGVLQAKSEIFEYMKENGTVIVNGDDSLLQNLNEVNGKPTISFGIQDSRTVYAKQIEDLGLFGTKITVCHGEQQIDAQIPLPGKHMVYNALAAIAVADLLKLSAEEVRKGLADLKSLKGRSNLIQLENKVLIDDCYNANPVSVKAALDLLATASGRKVAILGDMFELGEKERELHEEIGAYAMKKEIDVLICVGELSSSMYHAAKDQNKQKTLYYFSSKEELLSVLPTMLEEGDTILVKASLRMDFRTIVNALQ